MDVSHLLSNDVPRLTGLRPALPIPNSDGFHNHHYGTRRSHAGAAPAQEIIEHHQPSDTARVPGCDVNDPSGPTEPAEHPPKDVAFELIIDSVTSHKARLPMRVQIFPHDSTESIITTVKNFHGLYDPSIQGINFEDAHGRVIIARYENFTGNSTVYVRVVCDESQAFQYGNVPTYISASPRRMHSFEDPSPVLPPAQASQILHYGPPMSRPCSRAACKRSMSPHAGAGGRGGSVQQARSKLRSRDPSLLASFDDAHHEISTYSDSDGGAGSVSSSRKSRSENPARAEISTENILEGGRRKRTKFESSVSAERYLNDVERVLTAEGIASFRASRGTGLLL